MVENLHHGRLTREPDDHPALTGQRPQPSGEPTQLRLRPVEVAGESAGLIGTHPGVVLRDAAPDLPLPVRLRDPRGGRPHPHRAPASLSTVGPLAAPPPLLDADHLERSRPACAGTRTERTSDLLCHPPSSSCPSRRSAGRSPRLVARSAGTCGPSTCSPISTLAPPRL